MAYNSRSPAGGAGGSVEGLALPVPRTLAIIVIIALLVLVALRHFYGAIGVEAGTK